MTNKDFSDRLSERLRGMGYDFDAASVQALAAAAKEPAECDMDAWVARFLRANRPHPRRMSLRAYPNNPIRP
jgi:hypothetical protein